MRSVDRPGFRKSKGRALTKTWSASLSDSKEISGKPFEFTVLHRVRVSRPSGWCSLGPANRERFQSAELRKLSAAALRFLKAKSIREIALWLDAGFSNDEFVSAAVEGAIIGDFEPDRYKTAKERLKGGRAVHTSSNVGQPGARERLTARPRLSPRPRTSPGSWSTNPPTA